MARRPRKLTDDEQELWSKVAKSATAIHPERPVLKTSESDPPVLPEVKNPRVRSFRIGSASKTKGPGHDLAPAIHDAVGAAAVAMDRKRFSQMKKGKLPPDARIDLHGLTMAQAHPALLSFILNAVGQGHRLVLVITGKGKSKPDHGPIPERHGVLRHQVPHWLNSPPLRAHVLQISEAHIKHGGRGAYYVYLRRAK